MASFQERLRAELCPDGYDPCMRRSLQSCILFEAYRCVEGKLSAMRPFQRKLAFLDQAMALLNTLDFIPPHQKPDVFWRTATSREPITDDIAWKRYKWMERELAKLVEKVKPHIEAGKSHAEACDEIVKELYEESQSEEGAGSRKTTVPKPSIPKNWVHAHNHLLTTFRLYYNGPILDDTFPEPNPPVPIVVPSEKPHSRNPSHMIMPGASTPMQQAVPPFPNTAAAASLGAPIQLQHTSVASGEDRQKILNEVRDHLDLLKEFEGVVPAEEINRRKRALFQALPPAPDPLGGKQPRL